MRGMIRDMMLYHGRRFSDPRQQVTQARGLLDFLASAVSTENNPYGLFLRAELERLREAHDSYLFHDNLEEENSPVYFHQFAERAASHGLRYLAEVDLDTMDRRNFPEAVAQAIARVSEDVIQMEQYMDFVRNRMFRQTLLGHAQLAPDYGLAPATLNPFFLGSSVQPVSASPDLRPGVREEFRSPLGSTGWSIHPIVKAGLLVLRDAWPGVVPFLELCSRALARIPEGAVPSQADAIRQLQEGLMRFLTVAPDLVEFRLRPLPLPNEPGARPLARALARWQAATGRPITNLRHEGLDLEVFGRRILPLLDGQRTRPEIVGELVRLVQRGDLKVEESGVKITDPERIRQAMEGALEIRLREFARQSLLLG
jgi:hypothetical protein